MRAFHTNNRVVSAVDRRRFLYQGSLWQCVRAFHTNNRVTSAVNRPRFLYTRRSLNGVYPFYASRSLHACRSLYSSRYLDGVQPLFTSQRRCLSVNKYFRRQISHKSKKFPLPYIGKTSNWRQYRPSRWVSYCYMSNYAEEKIRHGYPNLSKSPTIAKMTYISSEKHIHNHFWWLE